jgi:hypothetical protein
MKIKKDNYYPKVIVNGAETEDIAEMTDEERTNKFISLGFGVNPFKAKMYLAVGLTTNAASFVDFSLSNLYYEIFGIRPV